MYNLEAEDPTIPRRRSCMGRQHRGTTGSAERVARTGYLCLAIGFGKDHLYDVIIDASHGNCTASAMR
jgi:hypothetical protein